MDEIAVLKEQVQTSQWAERIQRCKESGMTVSMWCRENNINPKTYYYHLRKIRKEICEQIPVPVLTMPDESHNVKISIGEITAQISEGSSEQLITAVIRAMKNA